MSKDLMVKALAEVMLHGATRVHLDGHTWVRHDAGSPEGLLAQARLKIGELTERIDVLEAALRPFAEFAAHIDGNTTSTGSGSSCPLGLDYTARDNGITLGDCREARQVLKQQPEGGTE